MFVFLASLIGLTSTKTLHLKMKNDPDTGDGLLIDFLFHMFLTAFQLNIYI